MAPRKSTRQATSTHSKAARKKSKVATASSESLQEKKASIRAQFSQAKSTKTGYAGYIQRGKQFLADIVTERRAKIEEDPGWVCPEGIDTDILEQGFENPPNVHSVYALEMYLTQKCVAEKLGKSTAEGIHGAFAKHWDTM